MKVGIGASITESLPINIFKEQLVKQAQKYGLVFGCPGGGAGKNPDAVNIDEISFPVNLMGDSNLDQEKANDFFRGCDITPLPGNRPYNGIGVLEIGIDTYELPVNLWAQEIGDYEP